MSQAPGRDPLRVSSAAGASVLPRGFFDRPVLEVAPDLLGCVLTHETGEGVVSAEIVEVEAYRGQSDPASHAFRGKTARNAVMFGEPGHAYVYFTYGMHFCINLVCQRAGEAAAVLLRAGRVIEGTELAAVRRLGRSGARRPDGAAGVGGAPAGFGANGPTAESGHERALAGPGGGAELSRPVVRDLARGPARLCQALAITRAQNGADVCDLASPLRVQAGPSVPGRAVSAGPRVGVRTGAEVHWRFWIEGESAVSAYRPHVPRLSART